MFYEKGWQDSKSKKGYRKPKKFLIYIPEIQEKIYKESKKAVIKIIKDFNKGKKTGRILKANAFGSSLSGDMGLYYKKYQNIRYGSDVDLMCVVEPGFKPSKKWKLNAYRSHSDEYNVDKVENYVLEINKKKDDPVHPINLLFFIPGKHNYKQALKFTAIDEKASKKKGFLVETWFVK